MYKKNAWCCLLVGLLGAMLGLYGVEVFNQFVLLSLPLALRMISVILVYWLIALVPIIVMLVKEDRLVDYGFSKSRIGFQITAGIFIGIAMSFVLTFVPHLLGFGAYVDSGKRYQYFWQFLYEFFYCMFAVGFVEEFVFRGFIYEQIKSISQRDMTATVSSSVLFGVFHLFSGNIIQMLMTACIGAFFCFCRQKMKYCSILSLMIAHGIYDAFITVWASALR